MPLKNGLSLWKIILIPPPGHLDKKDQEPVNQFGHGDSSRDPIRLGTGEGRVNQTTTISEQKTRKDQMVASSRHSVSQSVVQKTACEKIKKARRENRAFFTFSRAVLCTAP